jgi:hypothetical protein
MKRCLTLPSAAFYCTIKLGPYSERTGTQCVIFVSSCLQRVMHLQILSSSLVGLLAWACRRASVPRHRGIVRRSLLASSRSPPTLYVGGLGQGRWRACWVSFSDMQRYALSARDGLLSARPDTARVWRPRAVCPLDQVQWPIATSRLILGSIVFCLCPTREFHLILKCMMRPLAC